MKREQLINEVKDIYNNLAEAEKSETFRNESSENIISSDKYYEFVLEKVIRMIDYGVFDRFSTGKEVVEAVTNNKELVMTKWDKDIKSEIETEEIPVH